MPLTPVLIVGTLNVVAHAQQHFIFRERHSVRQSLALGYDPRKVFGGCATPRK